MGGLFSIYWLMRLGIGAPLVWCTAWPTTLAPHVYPFYSSPHSRASHATPHSALRSLLPLPLTHSATRRTDGERGFCFGVQHDSGEWRPHRPPSINAMRTSTTSLRDNYDKRGQV